jgi:hypothetical protein
MTVYAKIKTAAVVLEPTTPASAPAGSIFNDSTNGNAFTNKTTGGSVDQVGATSSADYLVKYKKNMTGATIPAYKRVALKTDSTIVLADSDNSVAMLDIGMSLDAIDHNAFGRVLLNGANAPGALTSLGFATGDHIYLSKTPGALTNSTSGFDPNTDTIMRVGIADCATGIASAVATDLIMTVEVYSSPGGA